MSEVIEWVLFGGMIYLCVTFYWLRILSLGTILLVWGATAVAAPVYFAVKSFNDGSPFIAIAQLGAGGFLSVCWWIAFRAAFNWVRKAVESDMFFRAWNARD